MLSKSKATIQIGLFSAIESLIDPKHPLFKLANTINWSVFNETFKKH